MVDTFVLYPLSWKMPVPTLTNRAIQAVRIYAASSATSDALRGTDLVPLTDKQIAVRFFYNLYNFYRNLPNIISPYLATFFIISLLYKEKLRTSQVIKIGSALMIFGVFSLAALTLPLYRYIHPIIPLVYIFAVGAIVKSLRQNIKSRFRVTTIAMSLILLFSVGQTLGDSTRLTIHK
jgi:hypothetical protein